MKLNITDDLENMIDKLTAMRFDIIDRTAEYLNREIWELSQDYTSREDFYIFRGSLIFARELGLIDEYSYDRFKKQVAKIWDAYQEAAAPPNILNALPIDLE